MLANILANIVIFNVFLIVILPCISSTGVSSSFASSVGQAYRGRGTCSRGVPEFTVLPIVSAFRAAGMHGVA